MKKVLVLSFALILLSLSFVSAVSAQDEAIKCYSSKDCPITSQYWCDGQSACQKLSKCLNPGQNNSECTVIDECVNCINIGYLDCRNGQCKKIDCYKDEDCGASTKKKYCSGSQACVSESVSYCYNAGTIDSYCTSKHGEGCIPCAYGCQDGECIIMEAPAQTTTPAPIPTPVTSPAPTPTPAPTVSPVCSDTDGGLDFYVRGYLMMGSEIISPDTCIDDGITLREQSCVPNPGPNEGTMSTTFWKCPNGCKEGACIKGEQEREEVKCIFKNTKTEQKCYRAEYNWMYCSSYQGSCIVTNLEGYAGEKITWKSTCGGYAYTTLDGGSESIEFDCSGVNGSFCQSSQCPDGSWSKCYVDGKGYCTCSTCSQIIIKPVCGNGICESGEGDFCSIPATACEAGKECKAYTTCKTVCPEDCKEIEGIYAKLNEKFKLKINQPVKLTDYKDMKINFRDLITPKCEAATTNVAEVKEAIAMIAKVSEVQEKAIAAIAKVTEAKEKAVTGMAVAPSNENIPIPLNATPTESTPTESVPAEPVQTEPVEIITCPNVGPMAQLEIVNPEEMGKKILTLRLGESKNIYDVSVEFLDYDYASRTGVFIVNSKTTTCPEHCRCDDAGYALECRLQEINITKCEDGKMLCPDGSCKEKCEEVSAEKCDYGCLYNTNCLPIGVRAKDLYCGIDGTLTNQLKADESCDNNFECESNICVNDKCISGSLIQRFLDWFKKLFGG